MRRMDMSIMKIIFHRSTKGDILIHGHTHVLKAEQKEGYILLNPGSVSIPKEGNPPTYAVLEDKTFTIKDFDGNIIQEQTPEVDYTGFDLQKQTKYRLRCRMGL